MKKIRIRCPKCAWEPDGRPYWQSTCGNNWDSFATGARCPGCGKVWEETQYVLYAGGCNAWSPHLDWYEGLENMVDKLKTEIRDGWAHPVLNEQG